MKAITLRNVPPELAKLIEHEAAESGLSLNRTVIRLLEKGAGMQRGKQAKSLHHDLDHLAGSWTEQEAAEFDQALAEQRRIDPELWE
jgi:predicted metalloprotease